MSKPSPALLASVLTLSTAIIATPAEVGATCMRVVDNEVRMLPDATTAAPRNTEIHLAWTQDRMLAPAQLELRSAGARGVRIDVAVTATVDSKGTRVTLRPLRPLAANASYQVVDLSTPPTPRVIGTFKTGATHDTQPPTWSGKIDKAVIDLPKPAPPDTLPRGGCGRAPEMDQVRVIRADDGTLVDDTSGPAAISFAVWHGDKKSFDPAAPPALIVPASTIVDLEAPSFDLPAAARARGGKLALVIAPIDLAGNIGAPVFVVARRGAP